MIMTEIIGMTKGEFMSIYIIMHGPKQLALCIIMSLFLGHMGSLPDE